LRREGSKIYAFLNPPSSILSKDNGELKKLMTKEMTKEIN